MVVLWRLPLLQNGDLGFPCPSVVEEEDDILQSVLLLLLEQRKSKLRSGQQRERVTLALKLELFLMVQKRGGRTLTWTGEAPLQSWLLPSSCRSADMLHSDVLKVSPRLPQLLLGAILFGCPSNQGMSFPKPMQGNTATQEGIADHSV